MSSNGERPFYIEDIATLESILRSWGKSDSEIDKIIKDNRKVVFDADDRVTKLILGGNKLSGPIPAAIGDLKQLTELDLRGNKLSGPIPGIIGDLKQLTRLDLSSNDLSGPIPDIIGDLKQLTWLDLSSNKLSGPILATICNLTELTSLSLSFNPLIGPIPTTIGNLTKLTRLRLSYNQLSGHIPAAIGDLKQLTSLDLDHNQLSGPIPDIIGDLKQLTRLDLSYNQLSGPIPANIGNLSELTKLDLHVNKDLTGLLPFLNDGCKVYINATNISRVSVRTKKLKFAWDYAFVLVHIILGYLDLGSDIFAIITLLSSHRLEIAFLNIAFLCLNVLLSLFLPHKDLLDYAITVFQLRDLIDGGRTLISGEQTESFVASKKLDAVARSLPSVCLQLYSLSDTTSAFEYYALFVSISIGIVGSSTTLGQLAPKAGKSIFQCRFVLHFMYYNAEILLRVLIITMMFMSIGLIAFVICGFDWILRCCHCGLVDSFDFSTSIMFFGSDNALPTYFEILDRTLKSWYFGSFLNVVELFMFLIIINTLKTEKMDFLREDDTVRNVTILSCCALVAKFVLFSIIEALEPEAIDKPETVYDLV